MANADRTEKPTAKRIREARRRGQVARSREVVQAAVLAAGVLSLSWFGVRIVSMLERELAAVLAHAGDAPLRAPEVGELTALAVRSGGLLALAVGPVAAAAALVAIAATLAQIGFLVTMEPLTVNWNRLNPANGLKRFGAVGLYDFLKMAVLVAFLGLVGWRAAQDLIHDTPRLSRTVASAVAVSGWAATERMLVRSLMVLALVAAADYAMQRYRWTASLRMTKQEVKDEARQQEGSPEVKGRVRRIQREMVRRRMLAATRRATVVVTNPTHYAVALEYRRAEMAAPRVVAKGRGLLAQRIKEIAREAGVPIIEQVALAQALYKTASVGETIPAQLFEAVAEMLAYLIRMKQVVL